MTKVRQDEIGIYVMSGGYIARPFNPTKIVSGSTVKARHIGGSHYQKVDSEQWSNSGMAHEYKGKTTEERLAVWQFYKRIS